MPLIPPTPAPAAAPSAIFGSAGLIGPGAVGSLLVQGAIQLFTSAIPSIFKSAGGVHLGEVEIPISETESVRAIDPFLLISEAAATSRSFFDRNPFLGAQLGMGPLDPVGIPTVTELAAIRAAGQTFFPQTRLEDLPAQQKETFEKIRQAATAAGVVPEADGAFTPAQLFPFAEAILAPEIAALAPPAPSPPPEPPPAPVREAKPVSFISTAVGGLGSFVEGLIDFGTDVLDVGETVAGRLGLPSPIGTAAQIGLEKLFPTRVLTTTQQMPAPSPTGPAPFFPSPIGGAIANMPFQLPATALPGGAVLASADRRAIEAGPLNGGAIVPRVSEQLIYPSRVDVPRRDNAGNLRFVTYKNMGRPLLFSGDLAACKRVRRVAARAKRAKGR